MDETSTDYSHDVIDSSISISKHLDSVFGGLVAFSLVFTVLMSIVNDYQEASKASSPVLQIIFKFGSEISLLLAFFIGFTVTLILQSLKGNSERLINLFQSIVTISNALILMTLVFVFRSTNSIPTIVYLPTPTVTTPTFTTPIPSSTLLGLNQLQRAEVIQIYRDLVKNSPENNTLIFEEYETYIRERYGIELVETLFCEITPKYPSVSIRTLPSRDAYAFAYLYEGETQYAYAHSNGDLNVSLWWAVEVSTGVEVITGWIHSNVVEEITLGCAKLSQTENTE